MPYTVTIIVGGEKMAKIKDSRTPTDEEIFLYDNVPVTVAAAYLGCGVPSLREALQQGKAPFGYAVRSGTDGGKWMPQISPGQLVAFKTGTLPVVDESKIVSMLTEAVEKVLDLRSKAALEVLAPGLLAVHRR
jgi:hypothetical protein